MLRTMLANVRRQTIAITALVVSVLAAGTAFSAGVVTADTASIAPQAAPTGRFQWDIPSKDTGWYTKNPDGHVISLGGKSFTVPADGFYSYQFSAQLTFSPDAGCDGDRTRTTFELNATIDDDQGAEPLRIQAYGDDVRQGPNWVGSDYLKAGTHRINLSAMQANCPQTTDTGPVGVGSGTVNVSDGHFLIYPS